MSLVYENVVYLEIGLADNEIQQALRCHDEDEIMVLLQRVIACSRDYAVVHLFQQLVQSLDGIFPDFINKSLDRNYTGKNSPRAVLNLILDKHLHDEGLSHRGLCGVTESVIV